MLITQQLLYCGPISLSHSIFAWHRLSGTKNQTRDGWVGSTDVSSVLSRLPISIWTYSVSAWWGLYCSISFDAFKNVETSFFHGSYNLNWINVFARSWGQFNEFKTWLIALRAYYFKSHNHINLQGSKFIKSWQNDCASTVEQCQQHLEFRSGLPSKYYPDPMLLKFSAWTETGVSNMAWWKVVFLYLCVCVSGRTPNHAWNS